MLYPPTLALTVYLRGPFHPGTCLLVHSFDALLDVHQLLPSYRKRYQNVFYLLSKLLFLPRTHAQGVK